MVSQDLKETENSLQGGSLLRSALDYASMGIYILPAEPNGKRLLQKTRYKKPSTSIEIIKYWWSVGPNANIAIPLSVRNNALLVIKEINLKISIPSFISVLFHTSPNYFMRTIFIRTT